MNYDHIGSDIDQEITMSDDDACERIVTLVGENFRDPISQKFGITPKNKDSYDTVTNSYGSASFFDKNKVQKSEIENIYGDDSPNLFTLNKDITYDNLTHEDMFRKSDI